MSRFYEVVLVNAGLATFLALVAEAAGRWLHRPALAHCLWVLALLKLVTPPIWSFDIHLPALAVSKPSLVSRPVAGPFPTDHATIDPRPVHEPARLAIDALPGVGNPQPGAVPTSNWLGLVAWAWLSGTVAIAAIVTYRAWRFCNVLTTATEAGVNIRQAVAQLAEDIGIEPPPVWLMPGAISPMIWAFNGCAQLLLPATLTEQLSPSELKTLLMHELAHIRRKDHWVRWIEIAALAVCWWHPVTWWARRRIEELEEECCDAWVLATLADAAPTYARALLATVEYVSGVRPALPPLASGLGYVKFLKRRLTMIMHGPHNYRLSRPLWAAALVLGALILPLSGKALPATRAADDDEPATAEPAERDGKSQDLDRRLRALETRMDRLLQSLERNASSENARVQEAERRLEEAKRRIADAKRRVDEASNVQGAEKHLEDVNRRVRERSRSSDSKRDLDQLTEDLQKQIENAVHQAIDPKRLAQMEKEIEQIVHEQLGSERMAAMGKQIEQAVNRAMSPEKIEAMERQIEQAINRNLQLEKSDRARRERARDRESREARAGQTSDSKQSADLERRVEKLEAKMDRLLEAVEKSQKR
jgi:beta-lactamase regulating signal transducer with metallopeptidase domain